MFRPVRALLDANVLYSNHLRNLLLQLAQNEVFIAKWSTLIEDEWLRNVEQPTRNHIEARTLPLIRDYFPQHWLSSPHPIESSVERTGRIGTSLPRPWKLLQACSSPPT
jgi:hypothetical protein